MKKLWYHQVAAVSILLTGVVVLLAWGRSMGQDSGSVLEDRNRFQGVWVASVIESGDSMKLEGASAEPCRVEFDGKNVVFHNMIDEAEARGTYYLEKQGETNRVDFKLDAGWIIGVYEFEGDTLKIALNAFAPPERLGVPTRPRPKQAKPGARHLYYEFRRPSKP